MVKMFNDDFMRLNISVLTVSDSRTEENDKSEMSMRERILTRRELVGMLIYVDFVLI